MIKLFRNIRQKLIKEGKTANYLKYAIGEIVLVVIGILIALQVNNWNSDRKDHKLSDRYLRDLRSDLKKDSLQIAQLLIKSNSQILSKLKLQKYLLDSTDLNPANRFTEYLNIYKDLAYDSDSIKAYFISQFTVTYHFTPITTTIDEMKNTGNIGIIKNDSLRRLIIEVYNKYDTYKSQYEEEYAGFQKELLKSIRSKVPSTSRMKNVDIKNVMKNYEVLNGFEGNFAFGIHEGLLYLQNTNQQLLDYLNSIKTAKDD